MIKRLLSLLVASVILLSCTSAFAELKNTDPITITMLNRVNAEVVFEGNAMLEAVAERTGITLQIDAPPISNYTDRLQVVMASGDLPDLIYTWDFDTKYEKWAEDDLVWALDDFIEAYPNLMSNITKPMWERARASSTGKIHAVPRPCGSARWGVISNQEWLETLDSTMPTNLDELYEYGKKVATMDPDGNGKDDTFLFSPYGLWADVWLISAFVPFPNVATGLVQGLPDTDGEYKVLERMSGYYPYLEYMRKLYSEKIIDPEFFANKYYDDRTKFQQNRVAMVHGGAGNIAEYTKDVSNAMEIYKFNAPMIGEDQTQPVNYQESSVWGGWMISKDVDEEKLDRILSFLDWCNSEEGFILTTAGVQGIDYESYDFATRTLIKTDEQMATSKLDLSSYMSFAWALDGQMVSPSDTPEKIAFCNEEIEAYDAIVKTIQCPTISLASYTSWPSEHPDLVSKKKEMEVKYVVGEIELEDLQSFIDEEWLPAIADVEQEYIAYMQTYDAQ